MSRSTWAQILDAITLAIREGYVLHDDAFVTHAHGYLRDKTIKRSDLERIVTKLREV